MPEELLQTIEPSLKSNLKQFGLIKIKWKLVNTCQIYMAFYNFPIEIEKSHIQNFKDALKNRKSQYVQFIEFPNKLYKNFSFDSNPKAIQHL